MISQCRHSPNPLTGVACAPSRTGKPALTSVNQNVLLSVLADSICHNGYAEGPWMPLTPTRMNDQKRFHHRWSVT